MTSINAATIALFDRIHTDDQIMSGTLTFSDGSIVATSVMPNDGSALVVTLPYSIITTFVRFTVKTVSPTTSNAGLAEFAAYGSLVPIASSTTTPAPPVSSSSTSISIASYFSINLAFSASVTSSSEDSGDDSLAVRAIDGIVGGYMDDGSGDQVRGSR